MGIFQGRLTRTERFWTGYHVLIWTAVAFLLLRGDYTDRVYKRLATQTVTPGMSRQDGAIALTQQVQKLIAPRREIWGQPVGGAYAWIFNSSYSMELNTPQGACGSSSAVLVKALHAAGIPARFVQMRIDGVYGAHILTEAEIDPGHWGLLDASYGTHFTRPDGRLASFADIRNDPAYYLKRLPAGYDGPTEFSDARYTNWTKIPVVMPALHWVLSLFMSPEELNTFCLRSHFLNINYVQAGFILVGYALILLMRTFIRRTLRHTRSPNPLDANELPDGQVAFSI